MSNNAARRAEIWSLLGDLPERNRAISAQTLNCEECEHYFLETLRLELNGQEAVPAYFTRPKTENVPFPTVLYHHAHGGDYQIGKTELIDSRDGIQKPGYAEALARRGIAALCIDHWAFGERAHNKENDLFKLMLWRGQVLWGMMLFDSVRSLDYLETRRDVDSQRIATMGASMGSTLAWWTAALDERIKVCIDICCLTEYQALIEADNLSAHGLYYYVPSLLKHFTSAQINALISPRPHLALAGNFDPLTPPVGLDRIDAELKKVYAQDGADEAWELKRWDVEHEEIPEMRVEVLRFLEKWL